MKLDLIDGRRNPGLGDDPLEVLASEIRDPDRPDPALFLQTNERLPAFDIELGARTRPMDQVEVELIAASLLMLASKARKVFVEAMIGIAEFRRDEHVGTAGEGIADALLVPIHRRCVDQPIAFVDGHPHDSLVSSGGVWKTPSPNCGIIAPSLRDTVGWALVVIARPYVGEAKESMDHA